MKKVSTILLCILLLGASTARAKTAYSPVGLTSWPDAWLAESAFFDVWARADGPVVMRAAGRSWLWGPGPFAVANEAYAESPTGKRLVEYLDKGRMEVNDPSGDRTSNWFVTSGLLVSEMVSGRLQTGSNSFESRAPASVPVAGDAVSPNAPAYAAFSPLTAPVARASGGLPRQAISKDGAVRPLTGPVPGASTKASALGMHDEVSGHNVPAVFTDWMAQTGPVLQRGRLAQGRIMDPLFVLGRPITEAYWLDILVGGAPARVLAQLFERRILTYNPANPPEWQVEMGNVGRAYFDWRYGSASPEPAISVEVASDGVRLRGWNWPPNAQVSARIDLAGSEAPLGGPLIVQTGTTGTFKAVVPVSAEIEGALLSGANLRAVASVGGAQAALPLSAKLPSGNTAVEGMLTSVVARAGGYSLLLKDHAGKEWKVILAAGLISYSEGDEAQQARPASGDYVRVEGTARDGTVNASSLRIMSVSRTGARLGYSLENESRSIRVSGTNWPPSHDVTFSIRPFAGGGVQVGTARSDSRGNVTASFSLPSAPATGRPLWLFAQVVEQNGLLAQVALLHWPPEGTEASGPPVLSLLDMDGEQMGGLGSYCRGGRCVEAVGVPVPGDAMLVRAGQVLGLRSQSLSGTDVGLVPQLFMARLYAYPIEPASEGATLDGTYYFGPKSLPIFSMDEVPGRPFSVSLPGTIPSGKYLLLVNVVWPQETGAREEALYGFALEVPPDLAPALTE